ncbi:cytochrome P450 [Hygrophoropsis aurantiaca]|uniref:Cytochrome P450 n=1 Tax=Hygrophoropsis aurantiaca TaxID=72124 RepID=A0ACB7ZUD0_9AGAM|nr:cytochrome P450 [Hygrophoropsis aurantiaca]
MKCSPVQLSLRSRLPTSASLSRLPSSISFNWGGLIELPSPFRRSTSNHYDLVFSLARTLVGAGTSENPKAERATNAISHRRQAVAKAPSVRVLLTVNNVRPPSLYFLLPHSIPAKPPPSHPAVPLNLANSASLRLLSPAEQTLCSQLRILPKPYLIIKEMSVREYARRGGKLRRREARNLGVVQAGFLRVGVDLGAAGAGAGGGKSRAGLPPTRTQCASVTGAPADTACCQGVMLTDYSVFFQSGLALVIISAILLACRNASSYGRLHDIPMPPGSSILWGHEKIVFDMPVGAAYTYWFHCLKSQVIKIRGALFTPDIVVIADPLAVTHIMRRRIYHYPHSEVVRPRIARLLGKSLGWVEGEDEHKRMRLLVSPALSTEAIKRGASDLQVNLEDHVTSNGGSSIVNIMNWVNQATLDIIGRFGFGHDFDGGRSEEASNILGAWRRMAQMGTSKKGFQTLMLLRRFPILNFFAIKVLAAQGDVRQTIHNGVAKELLRRSNILDGRRDGNDLLTRLLLAHDTQQISTDELMDHISMFMYVTTVRLDSIILITSDFLSMAGSETSSQTLGYAIWELAKHPDKQRRLREEVMTVAAGPSYDDVQANLPYLDAVVREVLRIHPAAPSMERIAMNDDVLPLRYPITSKDGRTVSTLNIAAGQTVIIPIHSINRLDSVWGDGGAFRPERWMEDLPPKDILPTGWSHTLAFSDGPRNCVGYRLAIFQIKVILMTLIRSFEFHDTGAVIFDKVASSVQPLVVGQEERGPYLPIKVTIVS